MEKPYTGLTALVKINDTVIGYIDSVDLNLEKSVIEIKQFGSSNTEKVPAIKNWTASSEGTVAFEAGGSQHKMYEAYESGELVELTLQLNEFTYFKGNALISSLSISGAPDDSMKISVEFEGSGGVTFTLPQTFMVSIASGVGGTTSPAGDIRVKANESLTITVTPAAGMEADKYYVNDDEEGQAVSADSITLSTITADQKVRVTFKAKVTA